MSLLKSMIKNLPHLLFPVEVMRYHHGSDPVETKPDEFESTFPDCLFL